MLYLTKSSILHLGKMTKAFESLTNIKVHPDQISWSCDYIVDEQDKDQEETRQVLDCQLQKETSLF